MDDWCSSSNTVWSVTLLLMTTSHTPVPHPTVEHTYVVTVNNIENYSNDVITGYCIEQLRMWRGKILVNLSK